MFYVYIIQSLSDPNRIYAGYTTNVQQRIETHNSGGSIYTKQDRPWKLVVYLTFTDQKQAKKFEEYLKTSAGRAFAKKRFW